MDSMRALLVLALLAAPLAGCLDAATVETADTDPAAGPAALVVDGATVPAGIPVRWEGNLDAPNNGMHGELRRWGCFTERWCDEALPACDEGRCERREIDVLAPADLVLTVRWPTASGPAFAAWIEDASGKVAARGTSHYLGASGLATRLEDAAPGRYTAVVVAERIGGPYQAALLLEPAREEGEARELLPNLVTLPPTDLRLDTPRYMGANYVVVNVPGVREVAQAMGTSGCRLDETADQGARRCLRFSNAVGNTGEGPLEVRLAAGSEAFVQRVHSTDGTFEDVPSGAAEWHVIHAHWHNAASNAFTVHAYDEATRAVGEPVHEGRKGGICFADVGLVDVGLPNTHPSRESGWGCFDPSARGGAWVMGLTPGWYDLYAYMLSDQFVDITGLEDGAYALCSVTNGEGTLRETDLSDNTACTPFLLEGDAVEPLEPEPYHATVDDAEM